ncbi:MAG: hypothetical protein WC512_04195 [Candidatus Omnitrophota bacterium]
MEESAKYKSMACESCGKSISYRLVHNGFNESSYAYCDKCGKTAIFDTSMVPNSLKELFYKNSRHNVISKELEIYIMPCDCGGRYRYGASPRCPHCKKELSAVYARKNIEDNSPGAKNGWTWQGNWIGIYAIIIEDKSIINCWKK